MTVVARYTILIFLGFLIALIFMLMLAPKHSVSTTTAPVQPGVAQTPQGQTQDQATKLANGVIQLAKAEVRTLTGVSPQLIVVTSQQEVNWPDTSLGCPKQGFYYAQTKTPGYKLVIRTPSEQFEYHTDLGQSVILCQSKRSEEQ